MARETASTKITGRRRRNPKSNERREIHDFSGATAHPPSVARRDRGVHVSLSVAIVPGVTMRRFWAFAALTTVIGLALASTAAGQPSAKPGDPQPAGRSSRSSAPSVTTSWQTGHARPPRAAYRAPTSTFSSRTTPASSPRSSRAREAFRAEYFLARLTFQQIYDVASFVAKYAGKPAPKTVSTATTG